MLRVLAIFSAQDDGTRKSSMAKFTVGTFATLHPDKTRRFQFGNQLSYFSWHELDKSRFSRGVWFVNVFQTSHRAGPEAGAPSHGLLTRPVVAFVVEVNQDFARFGTPALADDAAVFQFVHDARGAAVTEAQTALQQ